VRLIVIRKWRSAGHGPLFCLAGLVLLTAFQLMPLPRSLAMILSPNHVSTNDFYLPQQRETLLGESPTAWSSTTQLTLLPGSTRSFLLECIVLSLMYVLAVNVIVTPAAFNRLAYLLIANGTLISLLAFAQRLSSTEDKVYWSIGVSGVAYGPFASRNYFPYYANICIGLCLGMLGSQVQKRQSLLQNSKSIWLLACLATMMLAVLLSLSRGGTLSMFGAIACGGVVIYRNRGATRLGPLLWIVPGVLVVGGWLGGMVLQERFAKIGSDVGSENNRLPLWRGALEMVPGYPVFGTGADTFSMTELMTRTQPKLPSAYDYLTSSYLEALLEGGLARLGLTITLVVIISLGGLRQYRHYQGRSLSWLILGGLIGFWAVAMHSIVDFGMHVPSIALTMAVVVAFFLTARHRVDSREWIALPLPAAGLLSLLMVALGGLLVIDSYHKDQANRFVNAAFLESQSPQPDRDRMIEFMNQAIAHRPDHYVYRDTQSRFLIDASRYTGDPVRTEELLREAVVQARAARDLSPTWWSPQVRLALFRDKFANAPPASWYFERARRSAPADPFVWYASGKQRFDEGDLAGAWKDWQRSLSLAPNHLTLIVRDASPKLSPEEFLELVLPDNPAVIDTVMQRLYPDAGKARNSRQPFLEKSLRLLDKIGSDRTPLESLQRGRVFRDLNRREESAAALREGIANDPTVAALHWELATVLYELDQFKEAKKEVQVVLVRKPGDGAAKELLDVIERELILIEP